MTGLKLVELLLELGSKEKFVGRNAIILQIIAEGGNVALYINDISEQLTVSILNLLRFKFQLCGTCICYYKEGPHDGSRKLLQNIGNINYRSILFVCRLERALGDLRKALSWREYVQ